jgi:two-component system cell cycle response regulator DivK
MSRPDVLLIEDDDRNAALIRLALEPAGYAVTWARSVAEARLTLAEYLPPVILLDLRLPDEPGYVLAREVRAMPGGDGVLILAVSASVLEANRRQALEAGCDDFIEKPISPRDVLSRVRGGVEARV